MSIRIGVIGAGKIARAQHLPSIQAHPDFILAAIADPHQRVPDLRSYDSAAAMLAEQELDAVAICTPPKGRHDIALAALRAGKHVLLEKPPCATPAQLDEVQSVALLAGKTLFTAWHSRHAPAVEAARLWLRSRRIAEISVVWNEDVRVWHPGQHWIWQAEGLGVFDAGINALSILTEILPDRLTVTRSVLSFPANRQAPISAMLGFVTDQGASVSANFDWTGAGAQVWDIEARTHDGEILRLSEGGSRLIINGHALPVADTAEYPAVYARFAALIAAGDSAVDGRPLALVTDAFRHASRQTVAAFDES